MCNFLHSYALFRSLTCGELFLNVQIMVTGFACVKICFQLRIEFGSDIQFCPSMVGHNRKPMGFISKQMEWSVVLPFWSGNVL